MPVFSDSLHQHIFFGDDALTHLEKFLIENYSSVQKFVLTDENTSVHCLPLLLKNIPALKSATVLTMKSGEKNKNLSSCIEIWKQLNAGGAMRNSLVLNLGGGVLCDTGGFSSSVYLRGIDFIHIPTTLLSMADASIGGKTGIDLEGQKNRVGAFAFPKAVVTCPKFLDTLPQREINTGFAEIIKQALLSGEKLWNIVKQVKPNSKNISEEIISETLLYKAGIVADDPYEKGRRAIFNFGHTIGHAIETCSLIHDEDSLRHGEAVAAGMICALQLSSEFENFPLELSQEISALIKAWFPWLRINFSDDEIISHIKFDKKKSGKPVRFVLLKAIGEPVITESVAEANIRSAIGFARNYLSK
ncbi:MAG TPA: 3-dehydroquinate synthase [Bacteroidia bacterium]|nr:3-dehydroquinate synthase [Bacteroidia bacterium]